MLIKEGLKMTGELRQNTREEINVFDEDIACNCSPYTMAAVAGCLLFCIGIIIYALIGA